MRKVLCLLLIFFHINTYSNVNTKTELSFEEYELYTELNRSLVTISKDFIDNSLKEGEDSVALIGLKEYLGLINNVNFKHQYKLNTIINNTAKFPRIRPSISCIRTT